MFLAGRAHTLAAMEVNAKGKTMCADTPIAYRGTNIPPPGVLLKDDTINIAGLAPSLWVFLWSLGAAHVAIFGDKAVITSGRDSQHGAGSKHYTGAAVDLRIDDKNGRQQIQYINILLALADRYKLAVFDESSLAGAAHIHVEVAG